MEATMQRPRPQPSAVVRNVDLLRNPFILLPNQPSNQIAMSALSPAEAYATVSSSGPVDVAAFAKSNSAAPRVMLSLQDGSYKQPLMNAAIHADCIFGSARKPYVLPEFLHLNEQRSLQITTTDISGEASTFNPSFWSAQHLALQPDDTNKIGEDRVNEREMATFPFWYTFCAGFSTLAALGTGVETIILSQEFDFLLSKLSFVSTGSFKINIKNASTGRSILDAPGSQNYQIDSALFMGDGNFPYTLYMPLRFGSGEKIVITMTDTSDDDNTVFIALGGSGIRNKMWR